MPKTFDLGEVTARQAARRSRRRLALCVGTLLVVIALVALASGLIPHLDRG